MRQARSRTAATRHLLKHNISKLQPASSHSTGLEGDASDDGKILQADDLG